MSGFTYEEIEDTPEKRDRKRKRRKPMHLLSSAMNNQKTVRDVKSHDFIAPSIDVCAKEPSYHEQPLLQVLQEINNKITNQRRLWIDLDS